MQWTCSHVRWGPAAVSCRLESDLDTSLFIYKFINNWTGKRLLPTRRPVESPYDWRCLSQLIAIGLWQTKIFSGQTTQPSDTEVTEVFYCGVTESLAIKLSSIDKQVDSNLRFIHGQNDLDPFVWMNLIREDWTYHIIQYLSFSSGLHCFSCAASGLIHLDCFGVSYPVLERSPFFSTV